MRCFLVAVVFYFVMLAQAAVAQDCSFADKHPAMVPEFLKHNKVKQVMPNAIWAGKGPVNVNVHILVNAQGLVEDTCVDAAERLPLGLITASRAAARKWRFKPLLKRKKIYQSPYVNGNIRFRFLPITQ